MTPGTQSHIRPAVVIECEIDEDSFTFVQQGNKEDTIYCMLSWNIKRTWKLLFDCIIIKILCRWLNGKIKRKNVEKNNLLCTMMSFTSKVLQSLVCAIVYWIFVYCISLPLNKTILRDHQQFMNINDLTSMTFDKISSR